MNEVPKERRELAPWLIGLILAGIVFVVLLLVINALGFGDDPVLETQTPAAPEALPTTQGGPVETDGLVFNFWDGSEGSFEDFRGQPLVLNFWASWCPACVAEMPDFESAHSVLGDQVRFVGANMQDLSRIDAQQMVNQTKVSYTLIEDPEGELYAFFGGISMPTTIFIDAAGNIVDTHSGAIFGGDLEAKIREVFGL